MTNNTEACREAFEKWAIECPPEEFLFQLTHPHTKYSWNAWQYAWNTRHPDVSKLVEALRNVAEIVSVHSERPLHEEVVAVRKLVKQALAEWEEK